MSDEPARARDQRSDRGRGAAPLATFGGGVLTGAAVTAALFAFVLRPAPSPPAGARLPAPEATAPSPASTPEPPAAPALTSRPEPSRSRGRADWLFFFKPGDQLVRMGDDAALGMVIRIVPRHTFPDGTTGPAYVLQLPDAAGQQVVDADELERGGRLR